MENQQQINENTKSIIESLESSYIEIFFSCIKKYFYSIFCYPFRKKINHQSESFIMPEIANKIFSIQEQTKQIENQLEQIRREQNDINNIYEKDKNKTNNLIESINNKLDNIENNRR